MCDCWPCVELAARPIACILKRSGVQFEDLVRCYCTLVRGVCCPSLASSSPMSWSRYRGRSSESYCLTAVIVKPDIYQDYQLCDAQNCVPADLPEAQSLTTGYHLAGTSVIVTTYVTTKICPLCLPSLVVSAVVRSCFQKMPFQLNT